ncbi:ethanolamine ammonia-lyase subunit EutC [Methylocucumis oryzae]|uniref:ethanolamine ammonia-lyase subunit EutC n=1 Tax=Methylocucumis oryzae TaxID=1632867 RepID=UPI000ACD3663|nr:ethanolamine ammonia-lyase subunit EutC [Methylocucumis oryzae]
MTTKTDLVTPNPWQALKRFTPARIALGRAGMSQSTETHLNFQLAHALARDAVNLPLDFSALANDLNALNVSTQMLSSQASQHAHYLQRPDLGRKLSQASQDELAKQTSADYDAIIVVADGLSSTAIQTHAAPFIALLMPALAAKGYQYPDVCLVKHGRVAIGDAIAAHYSARFCIMLIGERPGLSSPDSMGIYFTYQAKPGVTTDAERNCISNIHGNGLSYSQALIKLIYLLEHAELLAYPVWD